MDWIIFFITIIFTYIISSQAVFLFLINVFYKQESPPYASLLLLSLGLGPIIISILTKLLIDVYPYHSKYFYISIILSFFFLLFLVSIKKIQSFIKSYQFLIDKIKKTKLIFGYLEIAILITVSFAYFLVFIQATALPIVGSDQVKFVWNSKNTYGVATDIDNKNIDINRFNKLKEILKGNKSPEALYTWFFLTNKPVMADILCRTMAPIYYLFLMILIGYLLWERGKWTFIWALVFFASIPLMIHQTIGNSQDPERIYLFILTFAWLAYAIERKKVGYFIFWIIILWFSIFSARANYLLIYFSITSILTLLLLKLKRGNIILCAIIFLSILIFFGFDIVTVAKHEKKLGVGGIYNYSANMSILNEINKYEGSEYLKLMRAKYILLRKIFNKDNYYNVIPILAIVSISIWLIYFKEKEYIDKIFFVSLLAYMFLVAFHNNDIFLHSRIYRVKVSENPYFLVYDRYLLLTLPFMVHFSAILFGEIFKKIRIEWTKIAIALIVLIILFIPVKSRLINKKAGLGIDDWKKIFSASDYEKLMSYRGGYGKIIDFIRENVGKEDRILTETYFKFIPYYSERECINSGSLKKKILRLDSEKIYEEMKEMGIKYILPTEKGRAFSDITQSPIQKVINDIGLAYIIYDSEHWRMYKLREEIKEVNKIPINIPNRKFEELDGNHPENWSVYSEIPGLVIDVNKINWGISDDAESTKDRICFLKNSETQSGYVYTGLGNFRYPPSSFMDDRYKIKASTYYYLKWNVKGSRPVQMNFWLIEYDQNGRIKWNLKKHMLNTSFKEMVASFKTGENAKEYRIAFHIFDAATLSIEDIEMYEMNLLEK